MQKYPNPPITEAVIEIRVVSPEGLELSKLEQLQTLVHGYPVKEVLKQVEIIAGVDDDTTSRTETVLGYTYKSEDGKQRFLAGFHSFSFSRLSPYEGWERFSEEARKLWGLYRTVAAPTSISRIGLRFINRLDLPWPFDDFREYLRTSLEVSPDLPQVLRNFLLTLEIEQPDIRANMRISQANLPPVAANLVPIMLDIDLYRTDEPPFEDVAIWEYLEVMRKRKNEIFEACLTDKARGLFR